MTNTTHDPQISTQDWIGFFGMVVGMFMAILDIQIVASSLQNIQAGLSATSDEIAWLQTSYLIAEVIIIPLSGWLSRALSTRYLFVLSAFGFTLMSLACAFAWNLQSMIVFRFIQGFFGGAMIPTVFATIYTLFPKSKQAFLTVIVGLVVTAAPTIGPILGGYLTEIISWHALFLINILPGIIVTLTTWFYVDVDKPNEKLFKQIDFKGITLIAVFLGTLQYVLEEGAKKNWFDSNLILTLSIVSLFSFVLMLLHELSCENPVIELRALQNKNFAAGCTLSFVLGWGMFSIVFMMPLYLGSIKGLNSYQIGSYVMVTGIFQLLSAPLAAFLSTKLDLRAMLAMGLCTYGIGIYLNSNLTHDSGYWEFFLPQALRGLSLMLCFLPINNIALGTLSVDEVKNASGLYNLMRNLGGAIGLAVTNTSIITSSKLHYSFLRTHINATGLPTHNILYLLQQKFIALNAVKPNLAAIKLLYLNTLRESSILTYNEIFKDIALLFFINICMIPFINKVELTDE